MQNAMGETKAGQSLLEGKGDLPIGHQKLMHLPYRIVVFEDGAGGNSVGGFKKLLVRDP
jgi:hypothetical protein